MIESGHLHICQKYNLTTKITIFAFFCTGLPLEFKLLRSGWGEREVCKSCFLKTFDHTGSLFVGAIVCSLTTRESKRASKTGNGD